MIVPDINLLLYAEIAAFPQHPQAKRWWESVLSGREAVGLPPLVLFGFVRIGTNPRLFAKALAVDDALERVEKWLAQPNVRALAPGPRHLEIAFGLLRNVGAAGNLTTDVQLAAYAIENAATLCSNDLDFGRFAGVIWKNPLTS
ncbi:MAG: type II toxin-antitoxin system VapC family toxin [Kofleriaceae bacterium]